MKFTFQQTYKSFIYIFPTFKPEIKIQSFAVSSITEMLAAICYTGIAVKEFITTPYILQKAVVTTGNLYTGKKSI